MSEYQYYEFRAVDRPLTREEMEHLRDLSSRAEITPRSFRNEYTWGDFKGSPRKLMESCLDAHFYLANWGAKRLVLRLPRTVLLPEVVKPYLMEDLLEVRTTAEHTIVEWRIENEGGGEFVEGEGCLDQLLPLREELARGDLRSF